MALSAAARATSSEQAPSGGEGGLRGWVNQLESLHKRHRLFCPLLNLGVVGVGREMRVGVAGLESRAVVGLFKLAGPRESQHRGDAHLNKVAIGGYRRRYFQILAVVQLMPPFGSSMVTSIDFTLFFSLGSRRGRWRQRHQRQQGCK